MGAGVDVVGVTVVKDPVTFPAVTAKAELPPLVIVVVVVVVVVAVVVVAIEVERTGSTGTEEPPATEDSPLLPVVET